MGILKRIFLVLGIFLCLYPVFHDVIASMEEKEIIEQYRSGLMLDDVIGILTIPSIQVQLPIYEGVTENVLQKGIGHIEKSSPLGGGTSTHCLLAGHRGLPEAEFLTRLGELEKGEQFQVEIKENIYTYKVCEIKVVRPEETGGLGIQRDRELVSLITCTPYGINTHRLIVTGERLEEEK